MSEGKNRREFTRVDAEIMVETSIGDAVMARGVTRNISAKGAYISCDHHLAPGTPCKMVLFLAEERSPYSIEVEGKVIRTEKKGIAVEFAKMEVVSLEHLKSIILHNSTNQSLIEAEFDSARKLYEF